MSGRKTKPSQQSQGQPPGLGAARETGVVLSNGASTSPTPHWGKERAQEHQARAQPQTGRGARDTDSHQHSPGCHGHHLINRMGENRELSGLHQELKERRHTSKYTFINIFATLR